MRMTQQHPATAPQGASSSPYGRPCPPGHRMSVVGGRVVCTPELGPPPQGGGGTTFRLGGGRQVARAQDLRRAIPPGIRPSAHAMIPPGIRPAQRHLSGVGAEGDLGTAATAWAALSTASLALSAYHGYKRNDSVGWALWWGLMGGMFPVITPTIALAQGYGKRHRG